MIDIHSHLIPNVDDGSSSVKETFNMIEEARSVGFTDIILTSHFLHNYYEPKPEELVFWKDRLQEVLEKDGKDITLHCGMEIYISNQLEELVNNKEILTLANSRYVLIELPISTNIKYLENTIYFLKSLSLQPIIAHPERYKYVQKDPSIIESYIDMGILIQCNYGSILGIYGKEAKKTIIQFLKKDFVSFLASDCHNEGTIYKIIPKAIRRIKQIVGESKFYNMSTLNPKKILDDELF